MLILGLFLLLFGSIVISNIVFEWDLWRPWDSALLSLFSERIAKIWDFGFGTLLVGMGVVVVILNV